MDIVEQIAKVVLPKVLPDAAADSAQSGLLSQFIAIFMTKVAGTDGLSLDADATGASIIQNVFPQAEERGELITKLSELHKVDESTTQSLLAQAAPLVSGELNTLAGDNSLQSFLGEHLSFLGAKLPTWATNLIPSGILGALGTIGAGAALAAGKVGDVAGGVADAAGNVVSSAANVAGDVAEGTVDAAKGAAGAVAGAAGAAVDKVGDVAGGVAEGTADLAKGAAGAAGAAVDKVGDVAGDAVDAGGSLLKKLLPILGLIGLGLLALFLWQKCATKPAPVPPELSDDNTNQAATPSTPVEANLTPASFNITTGEGDAVYACNGNVGDQGLKDKLVAAVKNVFNAEKACDDITVDAVYNNDIAGLDNVDKALEAIKAVPNATANFVNGRLVVNAPDAAARDALVSKLQGLMPGVDISPAAEINIETEVQQSVDNSLAALNALDEAANSRDIARALNLQIINFAVNKSEIPAINQPVLDKAVEVMTKLPKTELGITGHTDSDGDDAANQVLSESRANAVKAYLAAKGISAERLTTFGAGETSPVADNATSQGKFRNRRISFSAEKVGLVEAVTDAASSVADATGAVAGDAADAVGSVAEGTADAVGVVAEGTANVAGAVVEGAANATAAAAEGVADGAKAVENAVTE